MNSEYACVNVEIPWAKKHPNSAHEFQNLQRKIARDLEVQEKYGAKYLKYRFDENTGTVFCLIEAPSKEAAEAVHREAHGLMAREVIEIKEGS